MHTDHAPNDADERLYCPFPTLNDERQWNLNLLHTGTVLDVPLRLPPFLPDFVTGAEIGCPAVEDALIISPVKYAVRNGNADSHIPHSSILVFILVVLYLSGSILLCEVMGSPD